MYHSVMKRNPIRVIEIMVAVSFGIFLLMPMGDEVQRYRNESQSAAAGASAVEVPVLTYCAHWYARNGTACINDAKAGDEVVVAWDSGDLSSAIARCQSSGCKISFYCESGQSGSQRCDIPAIEATFKKLVTTYNAQMFLPFLEIDGIRDLSSGARSQLLQQLASIHWSLVLKNMNTVAEFSRVVPVARVVYEDIGPTGSYANEMRQLAAQYPNLLVSGILHSGCYASNLGGSCYQAVSREQAVQSFQQFAQMKNVELFYGLPSSYEKWKAFDGALGVKTSGVGTLVQTAPGAFAISPAAPGSSMLPASLFTNPQPVAPIPYTGTPVAAPPGASLYGAFTPQTATNAVSAGGTAPTNPVQGVLAVMPVGENINAVVTPPMVVSIPTSSVGVVVPMSAAAPVQSKVSTSSVYVDNTFVPQSDPKTLSADNAFREKLTAVLSAIMQFLTSLLSYFTVSK